MAPVMEDEEDEGSVHALKFVMEAANAAIYGHGLLVFDPATATVKRLLLNFGPRKEWSRLNITAKVRHFENEIVQCQMEGGAIGHLMETLGGILREALADKTSPFRKAVALGREPEARTWLIETLSRLIEDKGLKVETRMETISSEDAVAIEEVASGEKAADAAPSATGTIIASGENSSVRTVILDVKYFLSPVKGVSVRNLRPGMRIPVKLKSEKDYKAYGGTLKVPVDGTLEGELISVDLSVSDIARLVLNLAPGILGSVSANPEVLVKIAAEGEAEASSRREETGAGEESDPLPGARQAVARALSDPAMVMAMLIIGGLLLVILALTFYVLS